MKKIILLLLPVVFALACQQKSASAVEEAVATVDLSQYPETLQKVLAKHGGLDRWKKQRTLTYQIVRESGNEHHQIDLWNRRDRIESPTFMMGYDGSDIWLQADTSYKGNAVFYHNLMFYFYAMPFVLADDGINYSEAEPISFEGQTYPGVKISYNDGIGASPKDEYILHYHPETYQMKWLGYTATYFTQERKETFNWIRYNDWGTFDGVVLPNSISWYKVEDGERTEPRNTVQFAEIAVSEDPLGDDVFAKPEGAKVVE